MTAAAKATIYDKLVTDGEERQHRLKSMRDQLHEMERKHWVDVMQIVKHYDKDQ